MIRQCSYEFKIVVVGNSSVGKSSLIKRFSDDNFEQTYLPTIGVDYRFKSINIDDTIVKLRIWDTAGQQRFRTITSTYYKGAHGIFFVYDMTSQQSFRDIDSYWIGEVQKYAQANVQLGILGNKNDYQEGKFNQQIAEVYCKNKNIPLHFVSAKTGENVSEAFLEMAKKLTTIHPKIQKNQGDKNEVVQKIKQKKRKLQFKSGQDSGAKNKACC